MVTSKGAIADDAIAAWRATGSATCAGSDPFDVGAVSAVALLLLLQSSASSASSAVKELFERGRVSSGDGGGGGSVGPFNEIPWQVHGVTWQS